MLLFFTDSFFTSVSPRVKSKKLWSSATITGLNTLAEICAMLEKIYPKPIPNESVKNPSSVALNSICTRTESRGPKYFGSFPKYPGSFFSTILKPFLPLFNFTSFNRNELSYDSLIIKNSVNNF